MWNVCDSETGCDLQVTVFAVGMGTNISETELTAIASVPKSNHLYYLAHFRDITAFAKQITTGACKGDTETARFTLFTTVYGNYSSYTSLTAVTGSAL